MSPQPRRRLTVGGGFDGGARRTAPSRGTPEQQHAKFISSILAGEDPGDLWGEE